MQAWKQYDACELVAKYSSPHRDILIDVGSLEHFPVVDPHRFAEAAAGNASITLTNRVQVSDGFPPSTVTRKAGEWAKESRKLAKDST